VTKHANRLCRCGHEEFDHGKAGCRFCKDECKKFRPRGKQSGKTKIEGGDKRRLAIQQLHADIAAAVSRFEKNLFGEGHASLPMLKPSKKRSYTSVAEIDSMLPTLTKVVNGVAKNGEVKLGKGERKCMIAIAQHGDKGITKAHLTQLTSYKRSTRDAYTYRLRTLGYIIEEGAKLLPMPPGIAWLGHDYERLPTGDALRAYWMQRLPEGEKVILDLLCSTWPNGNERSIFDEATDYARSTRDAYISRLVARGLVVDVGRGVVKASDALFG
jgi:hypothetical protein